MWSRVVLLLLTLSMFGCTSMAEKAPLIRKEAFVHVKVVDYIDYLVAGQTTCTEHGICEMLLVEDYLVECAGHELLHTVKDNWHEGLEMNCKTGRVK